MNTDRLGAIDETYLTIEAPNMPLHVASIGIFDRAGLCDQRGRLRLRAIRRRTEARLGLLPRLRQRVVDVPYGIGRPVWVDDEHFDIAHHVDTVPLGAPHDEAALLRLAEALIMEPLDRAHPLWHLRFVTGLTGGRVALIERAHHAMVDGVSGVDVSLVLLDTVPDAPDGPVTPWTPAPTPSPSTLVVDALRDRLTDPLDVALRSVRGLRHPLRIGRGVADVGRALVTLRRDGVRAPRSSLNRSLGGSRRLDLIRQRLDVVRTLGAVPNATVNDVVLAAVASGVRDLFVGRGEPLPPDRILKLLIPVSVRTGGEAMSLGNRVGGLLLPLPIGIGDPDERLRVIAASTKALKRSREAATADLMLQAMDLVPPGVVHVLQRGVDHQPLVNMVVTNIPGPDFPLYAMGSRMLEAFPVVPLGASMTLEVAVLSYDGALTLSVTSDREACPDVEVFVRGIEHGFADLGASWSPAVPRDAHA